MFFISFPAVSLTRGSPQLSQTSEMTNSHHSPTFQREETSEDDEREETWKQSYQEVTLNEDKMGRAVRSLGEPFPLLWWEPWDVSPLFKRPRRCVFPSTYTEMEMIQRGLARLLHKDDMQICEVSIFFMVTKGERRWIRSLGLTDTHYYI